MDLAENIDFSEQRKELLQKKYGADSIVVRSVALALFTGMTTVEIAAELGMPEEEVSKISRLDTTKLRLRNLLTAADPARLQTILKAASIDAVLQMRNLLHSQDQRTALTAARYVIDRAFGVQTAPKSGLQGHELDDPTSALEETRKQLEEARRKLNTKSL